VEELRGRLAVITGAGSGIGRGTALALAEHGVTVVVADIDAERADAVAEEVRSAGADAAGIRADVTKAADLEAVREFALRRFGRIDIVMSNVGVRADGRPEDIPLEEWERVLDLNLMSCVRAIHVFVPLLLAQRDGHLVNTASTNPLWPYSYDRLPYTASKGAIVALTEGLAMYLRPRGVGVTCFCPSGVRTNLNEQVRTFGENPPRLRGTGLTGGNDDPLYAGRCLVDAIRENRVFAFTHPGVPAILRRRGEDLEGFMRAQIETFTDEFDAGASAPEPRPRGGAWRPTSRSN
jgi:NAD(P)-dependent dehydrogenase (short-subunit alcohol dehydrogenase family)